MYTYKASAQIIGSVNYPDIYGEVTFEQMQNGVELTAEIYNLPDFSRENGKTIAPFGFHLHEGNSCSLGGKNNPFPETGMHYNPDNQPHGNHKGDFPVLIATNGNMAYMKYFTDKFDLEEIIGKVVVIHLSPDDYRTEPSGNSGEKIACGVVKRL